MNNERIVSGKSVVAGGDHGEVQSYPRRSWRGAMAATILTALGLMGMSAGCAGGESIDDEEPGVSEDVVEDADAAPLRRHRTALMDPGAPAKAPSPIGADVSLGGAEEPGLPAGASGSVGADLSPGAAGAPDNNITYHGGPVMLGTVNVYFIFYGTWSAADKQILTDFASNIGGSAYHHINTTYYNSSNAHVSNSVQFKGSTTNNYAQGKSLADSDIQTIVSNAITTNALPKDTSGVYYVLSASDVVEHSNNNLAKFCADYCGWHTQATISNSKIKYSWVGNASALCPNSCGVRTTSPNSSPGVDAMVSVIAHELEEAVTDPDVSTGWWETTANGNQENADRCAWTFGTTYTTGNGATANMRLGNRDFLIQQNWVNEGGGYCSLFVRRPGDIDGDGRADIVATGVSSWSGTPLALSNGDGTFQTKNLSSDFNGFSSQEGAQVVTGDFNGDGKTDLAATGVSWWTSLPVTLSSGNGTFTTKNLASDFNGFSSQDGAKVLSGDFNGDGKTDILATGVSWWGSIPVAFSNGNGTFTTKNLASTFNDFSSVNGVKLVAGDFNGDGFTDIAATGAAGWGSIPVAFSNGNGTFNVTNLASTFNQFSAQSGAQVVAGDFNGDGFTDLAATGVSWWGSVPVAFSNGNGTFNVTNLTSDFNGFSSQAGAKLVVGDFDGDSKDDLAATGVSWWTSLPVAFSNGNGTFSTTNEASNYNAFSSVNGAKLFSSWR